MKKFTFTILGFLFLSICLNGTLYNSKQSVLRQSNYKDSVILYQRKVIELDSVIFNNLSKFPLEATKEINEVINHNKRNPSYVNLYLKR